MLGADRGAGNRQRLCREIGHGLDRAVQGESTAFERCASGFVHRAPGRHPFQHRSRPGSRLPGTGRVERYQRSRRHPGRPDATAQTPTPGSHGAGGSNAGGRGASHHWRRKSCCGKHASGRENGTEGNAYSLFEASLRRPCALQVRREGFVQSRTARHLKRDAK